MTINRDRRGSTDIYHGEPQGNLMQTIRDTMNHEGFRRMSGFNGLEEVRVSLRDGTPDLVVLDSGLKGGDVCSTVNELRYNELGRNPFVPVIVTTWEPSRDLIHRLASCGADAVLVKPFAPKQLMDRMESLAGNRRPFVVTSDYVGPDRSKETKEQSKLPLIEVPNTLRAKVRGEPISIDRLQQEIDATMAQVNEQKLSRHAYQIGFLVGLILPAYQDGKLHESTSEKINQLVLVTQDVMRRTTGTQYEHVSDLCRSLIGVVTGIQDSFPKPAEKDMKLLSPLSDAILMGFHPDTDAAAMASEITDSIEKFEARQARGAPVH